MSWARARARNLHAIAWRDRTISRLQAERELLGQPEADVPSFFRHAYADRRIFRHMKAHVELDDPADLFGRKLAGYSFAQSHGLRIPVLHGLWDEPEDIGWDELPDRTVIKPHTGHHSHGVFPLRRHADEWTVVTRTEPTSPTAVAERLRRLTDEGKISGPYFAEELYGGGEDDVLPMDVRVFTFYGEVGLVNVRKSSDHGNSAGVSVSRFLEDGTPGPVHPLHDDSITPPANLEELVAVAKRLSLAIPRPFVRVDLYDIDGDVAFGELTRRPGGSQDLGTATDRRLGELWEKAQARLFSDLIDGASFSLSYGPEPRELMIGDRAYVPPQGWVSP